MDWFRWWHGTVTDPKFQWVARKSGQSVASVLAVWAVVLETGSNATQGNADATRGNVASLQCEDWDVALGLDDGAVQSIYDAMVAKGLIEDSRIVAWDARQPKREDGGDPNTGALSSTERSRLHREKKRREATQGNDMQRSATHATDLQRTEEIREESKPKEANASVDSAAAATVVDLLGAAVATGTDSESAALHCPIARIVKAYHDLMPDNPRVKVLNDKRKRAIAARWREASKLDCKPFGYSTVDDGLRAWRAFFSVCAQSDFLTGKAKAQPGKPPFIADIDFLMSPEAFAKCLENKYHRDAA
ncbi:TPA: hypothetical protein ACT5B2_003839 [Burkholderia cenocepacia]|uniref:hypothetical protein n=1 Tax=Burkholderia cenocepacia TaxID=95486 RepID=UPI002AB6CA33|nr:hypothetical protein [Burkholderia cenocepacia]